MTVNEALQAADAYYNPLSRTAQPIRVLAHEVRLLRERRDSVAKKLRHFIDPNHGPWCRALADELEGKPEETVTIPKREYDKLKALEESTKTTTQMLAEADKLLAPWPDRIMKGTAVPFPPHHARCTCLNPLVEGRSHERCPVHAGFRL